jgi:putative NIF3 family GTP cyclohydrolase 1 type 2
MTVTIQEVIDTILAATQVSPLAQTVDTVKLGDPTQPVAGIITSFMPTVEVIEKAIALNANMIITHEPLFYNHPDEVDWLRDHEVYKSKRRKIEENKVVVWRFHDYMHRTQPDLIGVGLIKELGWEPYAEPDAPYYCKIPPMTLGELTSHVKSRLGINMVRVIGNMDLTCQGIGLLMGFSGKDYQIEALHRDDVDVIVCGEIHEWETSEYVRDAVHMGYKKALIVTGHAASEEPGMKWLVLWLQERFPGVSIDYIPTNPLFQWI